MLVVNISIVHCTGIHYCTAMCFRRYEFTRETLFKFKEEMEMKKDQASKGAGGGGAFGGFGGGAPAAANEARVGLSRKYCVYDLSNLFWAFIVVSTIKHPNPCSASVKC
jgi:hypothetical protein